MIYWNPKRHYRLLSPTDRQLYIEEMSPIYWQKWTKRINLMLNVITPLFLYFYLNLPLRELAFAFIAFDVILNVLEQVIFITLPWAMSKIPSLAIAQWQYNGFTHHVSQAEDRIDFLRKKHCEKCDNAVRGYKISCTRCKDMQRLVRQKDRLTESQKNAKERLDTLKTQRDNICQPTTPLPNLAEQTQSLMFDNTIATYFRNINAECTQLINTHKFDFLIAIRKSTEALVTILQAKPEGEAEVSMTLCYRLTNLVKLLQCLLAESDEVRSAYFDAAKTASNSINEELQAVILNIQKLVPGVNTNTPEMLLAKTQLAKENNDV